LSKTQILIFAKTIYHLFGHFKFVFVEKKSALSFFQLLLF
jgi:hypothetical protein